MWIMVWYGEHHIAVALPSFILQHESDTKSGIKINNIKIKSKQNGISIDIIIHKSQNNIH